MHWKWPAAYFILTEGIYLLYELGLSGKVNSLIGACAALLLVVVTFPALPIAQLVKDQTAIALGLTQNAIVYNSFWPRFASVQTSILICMFALLILFYCIYLGTKPSRNNELKKNS
jgi:hypothetical protein